MGGGHESSIDVRELFRWGLRAWGLRKSCRVTKLVGDFLLLDFCSKDEVNRVFRKGTRRFRGRMLSLER